MVDKITEEDLSRCVVDYFSRLPSWTLHHEVAAAGRVADFVATNGTIIHVIEVKKSQSLVLLDQLLEWKGHAHLVSGAVPMPKVSHRSAWVFRWALKQMGAGLFELRHKNLDPGSYSSACQETVHPVLHRKITNRVMNALCEEQTRPEDWAHAGSAKGGHFTPFRSTCNAVRSYVDRHPGATMKQIVDNIKHHYASDAGARSSLAQWIREGKVEGIKAADEGKGYVKT